MYVYISYTAKSVINFLNLSPTFWLGHSICFTQFVIRTPFTFAYFSMVADVGHDLMLIGLQREK